MSAFSRRMVITLLAVLTMLMAGGVWLYNSQRQQALDDAKVNLESIARLKVDRIIEWRNARLSHASVMMSSRYYTPLAAKWMNLPPSDEEIQAVLTGFRATQELYGYNDALFVGADGKVYFHLKPQSKVLNDATLQALAIAFQARAATYSDLYSDPLQEHPQLDLILPFFTGVGEENVPTGAIIYQYDIRPLKLDFWPGSSRSAETLLVRRDGDSVLFLNELRHQKNTALTLRIPLSRTDVPAVMAVMGKRGVMQGKDYRGKKVISAIESVPGTTWYMVAKVDESEALSPLRQNFIIILISFLLLTASTFTAMAVVFQRKEKTYYRSMFEAEAALRKSEARYRSILDSLMEGCQIIDFEWRFLYLNATSIRHSGHTKEELLDHTLMEIYPGIEADRTFTAFQHCMKERKPQTALFEADSPDKGKSWYALSVQPVPEGIFILSSDITEIKQMEAEKERLQSQLLQSQKLESVGRLAGGVAHDFNNMLNVILGHAQLSLESVKKDHPLYGSLEEINKAALRSAELTSQLLAFARKQTIAPKVLHLNDTVGGLLKMLQRLIGERIDLVWIPGHTLWKVLIDPSQVDQLLTNLAINARDAINKTGRITIETENIVFDDAYCVTHPDFVPGKYVLLALSDDGCGMDKDTRERIFEPFFTTKAVGEGTGLGLATTFGIVKQNKGFINVYSEPGRGSTFKIYLPGFQGEDPEEEKETPRESVKGGAETILLVEDEITVKDLAKLMLERLGYSVMTATTPSEAIRLFERHAEEIHLLIVDVVMPEMTGRDLEVRLRAIQPDLKLLYMSGYTADVIAHQGILDSDVYFIQKPFSLKALATKVRETLDD